MLSRALTEKQLLILSKAYTEPSTITSLVLKISLETGIPISTLKSSAKILKDIGTIEFGSAKEARLTELGKFILVLTGSVAEIL
ncbi:MAG: hypothetical protein ACHQX1_01735 [Candidatus Micrarchaeales archaeon]